MAAIIIVFFIKDYPISINQETILDYSRNFDRFAVHFGGQKLYLPRGRKGIPRQAFIHRRQQVDRPDPTVSLEFDTQFHCSVYAARPSRFRVLSARFSQDD
jgi:hypothetical protein